MIHRRKFLVTSSSTLVASMVSPTVLAQSKTPMGSLCVFTKSFNSLSFEELADRVAEMGFDGIEAPVRPGGHIEPINVKEELPKLVESLAKRNLEITVLASDINDPMDPLNSQVLRTAASLGIKRYRMKYFKYDEVTQPLDQIREWKPKLADLAAFNRDLGIRGLYQNHAGRNYMGASLWDLNRALDGISAQDIGVAYDIRHATAEAGMSWPVNFQMIRPRIDTVYVKDFRWSDQKRAVNVPLGQGWVDANFFQMLKNSGFDGPISLHEEYLDHRKPELVPQHLQAIRADFQTLRRMLGRTANKGITP